MKPILIGCGALAGLGVLSGVAIVAVIFYLGATAESKTTITLAGYSVDAPGKIADRSSKASVKSVGVLHRRTNSEFAISTKPVAIQGQDFELDQLIAMMKRQGAIVGQTRPVSRAGLDGLHLSLRQLNGLESEAELYKISDQEIMLLTYVSGNVKHDAGLGKLDRDPEKTKELDEPDAFFASLRKG
ncbi:hypothetical protein CA85_44750 [Allorhodopirellula solitaria]|uniref:Uncharacterized protein n=2 Tax=Allorhodopirellula solitaria TaxID=2527987 RepID=A0A5C5X1U5_9BACT|nr:hypothetical protein CA85_44750 [Allorhodopirellula solitaria]